MSDDLITTVRSYLTGKRVLIFLGLAGVIWCNGGREPRLAAPQRSVSRTPSPEQERARIAANLEVMTKDGIRSRMKDPDAVRFRNVRVVWDGDAAITCGEYNAKNGFGAYNGFKPFVGNGTMVLTPEDTAGIPAGSWGLIFAKCGQR